MGTLASVELADPVPDETVLDQVFAWLHEVDRRFSTFKEDSEVNLLQRRELTYEQVSEDMREVLDACARLWQATEGFFDAYAMGRLDPSGYVKGWSVQRASQMLTLAGAVNHVVEAGGDLQARGRPVPDGAWQIGIRHPWEPDKVAWVLSGTDLAVATSGTYERGLHVINPRTGRPATALRSVTVVGRHLADADAFATAAVAMGRDALTWLAGLDGYEAAVIAEEGTSYQSAGLPELRSDNGEPVDFARLA